MFTLSPHYFGEKSWEDIRQEIKRKLWFKARVVGRPRPEDMEDAVSTAVMWLLDYWVELPSSIDQADPERNFKWAVWFGSQLATDFFWQLHRERSGEVSIDAERDYLNSHDYAGSLTPFPHAGVLIDGDPTPDEALETRDVHAQARDLFDTLPVSELKSWLGDYLAGITETEQASREGVTQQAISSRRKYGMRRLRNAAVEQGMLAS